MGGTQRDRVTDVRPDRHLDHASLDAHGGVGRRWRLIVVEREPRRRVLVGGDVLAVGVGGRAEGGRGRVVTQHRSQAAIRLQLIHERLDRTDVAGCPLEEQAAAADARLHHLAHGPGILGVDVPVATRGDGGVCGVVHDRGDGMAIGAVQARHPHAVIDRSIPRVTDTDATVRQPYPAIDGQRRPAEAMTDRHRSQRPGAPHVPRPRAVPRPSPCTDRPSPGPRASSPPPVSSPVTGAE